MADEDPDKTISVHAHVIDEVARMIREAGK
ncbi:hypothetical protein FHR81_003180 [Actinoalloteichus hoggarensis]|uniref:Uncharacterized protein n=1 Tax=Actinoalloteichus hoggarensis TaxID=1470176 RepID=A0A221W874_9PSEU|nr:hypothetical protein AHOG_19575 [Actinoalloteichus hoggarensis]MBB5922128.1 hypothetical protein [Actinoalloteichus hoggarensis]